MGLAMLEEGEREGEIWTNVEGESDNDWPIQIPK